MSPHGETRYVATPLPRDVPGFAQAYSSGATPRVSPTPPPIVVTPTAQARLHQGVGVLAASVLACLLPLVFGSEDGQVGLPGVLGLVVCMVVGCVLIARAARRFGRAQLAELMHGYTTTTYAQGTWWLGGSPRGSWKGGRTFWDFRGTWVLRSNGEVVSPPTVNQEPPGLYPSPRNEGARELWTGCEWTNYLVSE